MKKFIVGNWKMYGDTMFVRRFATEFADSANFTASDDCTVAVCPPFPYLALARAAFADTVMVGAQDVSARADDGARTGEVSARMLADAGCALAIIGHSERRANFAETDALCTAKIAATVVADIRPILCVGENKQQRENGDAIATVLAQLDAALAPATAAWWEKLIIAYEPVWAIGSGTTPTAADIGAMHDAMRKRLIEKTPPLGDKIPLLYGGSVNTANAAEIIGITGVDGFLVGGASLKAKQFGDICAVAEKQ